MKKFMGFLFLAVVIIGGLSFFNSGVRSWVNAKYYSITNLIQKRTVEWYYGNVLDNIKYKIENAQKNINECEQKSKETKQKLEDWNTQRMDVDANLKRFSTFLKLFKECFLKNGLPDPIEETFSDEKYSRMTITILGETMTVSEAVKLVNNTQAEYKLEKEKRDSLTSQIENGVKYIDMLAGKCDEHKKDVADLRTKFEETRHLIEMQQISQTLERTSESVEKTGELLQETHDEAQAYLDTKKEVDDELVPDVVANATIDVEIKYLEEGETSPTSEESKESYQSLFEQMAEQMDNSAAKENKQE